MKIRWIVWLGSMILAACQSSPRYVVEGRITGYEGRILLVTPNVTGVWDTLGNMLSIDGTFLFEGNVTEPVMAEIVAPGTKIRIPLLIENSGFKVEANMPDFSTYVINEGGVLQQQRNEFRKKELEIKEKKDSLRLEYEKDYGKDYFGQLQIRGLLSKVDVLYDQAEDDFLRQHDNIVSAAIVYGRMQTYYGKKRLHEKYALLGENARNTVPGLLLKPYVDKESHIIVGGIAPNFKMITPEGDSLSLYDIKAKLKILDFWASWCGPCRAENPNVQKIYQKYKAAGLEVASVSFDTKKEAWLQAIREDNLGWIHLSDLKGWNSIASDLYEIHGIPYVFVLDENNRIIAEGLRGEELEECVAKALNK